MYLALQIDEILTKILSYCTPPPFLSDITWRRGSATPELAVLARTCRLLKEPALDLLWSELRDLTPLARCLPQVCFLVTRDYLNKNWYSFRRPLEQDEWDTLRSYTRRVRSVDHFGSAFRSDCVLKFLTPPTPGEPLFPNLRYLHCTFANEAMPLLRQPLPSLEFLDCMFTTSTHFMLSQAIFEPLPEVSPNIRQLSIRVEKPFTLAQDNSYESILLGLVNLSRNDAVSEYIPHWSDPRIVSCGQIALNVFALQHLSCVPNLTRLSFTLEDKLPDDIVRFYASLCFNRLEELELYSGSLVPVSKLLSCIQLPAMTDFVVRFERQPSKQDVETFFTHLQKSDIVGTIRKFGFLFERHSSRSTFGSSLNRPSHGDLVCNDLWPLKALKNLRHLDFNLEWRVGLTGDDLLELVSAWPCLEKLIINQQWGWRTSRGITPEGIIRLMEACPSLNQVALAMDTSTASSLQNILPVNLALLAPDQLRPFSIDVLDSTLGEASISDIVSTFIHLVPSGQLSLRLLKDPRFEARLNTQEARRWLELTMRLGLAFSVQRLDYQLHVNNLLPVHIHPFIPPVRLA